MPSEAMGRVLRMHKIRELKLEDAGLDGMKRMDVNRSTLDPLQQDPIPGFLCLHALCILIITVQFSCKANNPYSV